MRYSIDGQAANGTDLTMLEMRSTTAIRPEIYDLVVGSDATPADQAAEYNLNRTTTAGVGGSAVTPQALDPDDPAATVTAAEGVFATSEPVYTAGAVLLNLALNQRATFRWVAAPRGEIKLPAAAAGVGFRSIASTAAFNTVVTLHFEE